MASFSDHAYEKMMGFFDGQYGEEVGSALKKAYPDKYKNIKETDCITYVLNVLAHAFERTGDLEAKSKIWKLEGKGTLIQEYLVKERNWLGIYINPDVKNPADGDENHSWSNYLAKTNCDYYRIPIKFAVTNYSPTRLNPVIDRNKKETKPNEADYATLSQVKFGFGISRGGKHTWLFSRGNVYEVHWDRIGSDLYGLTPLKEFIWLSGSIVIPPDQSSAFQMAALSCAK